MNPPTAADLALILSRASQISANNGVWTAQIVPPTIDLTLLSSTLPGGHGGSFPASRGLQALQPECTASIFTGRVVILGLKVSQFAPLVVSQILTLINSIYESRRLPARFTYMNLWRSNQQASINFNCEIDLEELHRLLPHSTYNPGRIRLVFDEVIIPRGDVPIQRQARLVREYQETRTKRRRLQAAGDPDIPLPSMPAYDPAEVRKIKFHVGHNGGVIFMGVETTEQAMAAARAVIDRVGHFIADCIRRSAHKPTVE